MEHTHQHSSSLPFRTEESADTQRAQESEDSLPVEARLEEQVNDMMSEGGGSIPESTSQPSAVYKMSPAVDSTAKPPEGKLQRWLEDRAHSWGLARLKRLVERRGQVSRSMRSIPQKMHRTARQSELMLELVDDFRAGRYRDIPWRSVALLVGALLYTVSPADVIPDILPVVGGLDDVSILAIATRLVRKDLSAYCEFKGYDSEVYFGKAA